MMLNKILSFLSSKFFSYVISCAWWLSAWYQYSIMKLPPTDWLFAMCTAILFGIYALDKDSE